MKATFKALMFAAVTLLAACTTGPTLQEELMTGQWVGEIQGFPVTLEYTETEINVVGMGMSLPYKLEGNTMSFDVPGQGTMVFTVEVEGDTLTQTDVNSGEASVMKRNM